MQNKTKAKIAGTLAALTAFGTTTPALANDEINLDSYIEQDMVSVEEVLHFLYEKQMNSIIPVVEELNNFYTYIDNKDIIKSAYPRTYQNLDLDLGYIQRSYGSTYYDYVPNDGDYLNGIIKNNHFLLSLKITLDGSGREPTYGVIPDTNTEQGFRMRNSEDIELMSTYNDILNRANLVSENLLKVVNNYDSVSEDDLLMALKDIYESQKDYLNEIMPKLAYFYEQVDTENIIKNGFSNAYQAFLTPRDDSAIYNTTDIINSYLSVIIRNNEIINNLLISEDAGYGVIIDDAAEYGIRQKTDKDKELIENYKKLVGNYYSNPTLDYSVINLLNQSAKNIQNKTLH